MYVQLFVPCKYLHIYFSTNMELGDYISNQLEAKGLTKELLQKHLDVSRGTLYNKIKKSDFSVQEFVQVCIFLNISPTHWFSVQGFEHGQIDINQVNEPFIPYRKVKNSVNEGLKSGSSDISELIRQNGELIQIIKSLTAK